MSTTGKKMGRPKGGPKYGGRKKGTPNKLTKSLKELLIELVPGAVKEIKKLSTSASVEANKLAAIREIFDRVAGKPAQDHAITHAGIIGHVDLTKATDDELDILTSVLDRVAERGIAGDSETGEGEESQGEEPRLLEDKSGGDSE